MLSRSWKNSASEQVSGPWRGSEHAQCEPDRFWACSVWTGWCGRSTSWIWASDHVQDCTSFVILVLSMFDVWLSSSEHTRCWLSWFCCWACSVRVAEQVDLPLYPHGLVISKLHVPLPQVFPNPSIVKDLFYFTLSENVQSNAFKPKPTFRPHPLHDGGVS